MATPPRPNRCEEGRLRAAVGVHPMPENDALSFIGFSTMICFDLSTKEIA